MHDVKDDSYYTESVPNIKKRKYNESAVVPKKTMTQAAKIGRDGGII
jgi:hypothetical protein